MNRPRTIFTCLLTGSVLCALALLFAGELALGLLLAFATHLLLLYAVLRPSSQWLGPVITSFQTEKQEVWLTIDDGPDPEETPLLLDLLDRYQAKASFFVVGNQVKAHPDLVRQILERGHHIGNHTMNHLEGRFWCLFRRRVEEEICDCSVIIKEVTGVEAPLFRAPVGHKPWHLNTVLQKLKLPLIGWTARGFDGVSKNNDQIVRRIQKRIVPGAIILLHEGRGTLPDVLDKILSGLSDEVYHCVLPATESFVCGRRKIIK